MATTTPDATAVPPHRGCPVDHSALPSRRTDPAPREGRPAVERTPDGVWHIHGFAQARALLRADGTLQTGFNGDRIRRLPSRMREPILYQEGAAHRDQRAKTARFFTPTATSRNYRELMERQAAALVAQLKRQGRADLDDLSAVMAVQVAAQVVGLTDSLRPGMARRIEAFFDQTPEDAAAPVRLWGFVLNQVRVANFFFSDVRPAIRARRAEPREDVISHLLEQGYSGVEILTECITYAAAGMITTREFIGLAALQLIENRDLRERYLAGDESDRHKILHELLRLDPIVGVLHRRAQRELSVATSDGEVTIPAGADIALHVYALNADPDAVGDAPLHACPVRDLPRGVPDPVMSFGDGNHRCPGAYIAIQETDIFLTKLLAAEPQLDGEPELRRNRLVEGYELRRMQLRIG
jgi:cytochrome P450